MEFMLQFDNDIKKQSHTWKVWLRGFGSTAVIFHVNKQSRKFNYYTVILCFTGKASEREASIMYMKNMCKLKPQIIR